MTRAAAIAELRAQHDLLRAIMGRCEQLADFIDTGLDATDTLSREIVRLRVALDRHNLAEEQQLRPLLLETGAFSDARIDHMIAEHAAEHRAMSRHFGPLGHTSELRAALASLREHLAAEERIFVTTRVIRDDIVSVEAGG